MITQLVQSFGETCYLLSRSNLIGYTEHIQDMTGKLLQGHV